MNELKHWGFGKKDHKYVAKIGEGTNARYFYSWPEYQAYKLGETASSVKKSLDNAKSAFTYNVERTKNALSSDNMYKSNKWNYQERKDQITKTDEWKDIVKRKDSEYVYTDKNGETVYDYDQYLFNKKHPVLDVAQDYLFGRKASITKQSVETLTAGAHDYVEMGKSTALFMLQLSGAIIITKIKNQQGSYEAKKQELKKQARDFKDTAQNTYDTIKTASSDYDTAKKIKDAAGKLRDNNVTEEDVRKYARKHGIDEERARKLLGA